LRFSRVSWFKKKFQRNKNVATLSSEPSQQLENKAQYHGNMNEMMLQIDSDASAAADESQTNRNN